MTYDEGDVKGNIEANDSTKKVSTSALATSAPSKKRLKVLLAMVAVLVIATNAGSILAPSLVNRLPWLVLIFSSRNRHLLFSAGAHLSPWLYFPIAFTRLFVAAWLTYLLGHGWGAKAMAWFEKESGTMPFGFRWMQRGMQVAGVPIVALFCGSNLACALAGMQRMTKRVFALAISVGIGSRLIFFWFAAKHFDSQLHASLKFVQKYQWYLTVGFIVLTVAQSTRKKKRPQLMGDSEPVEFES